MFALFDEKNRTIESSELKVEFTDKEFHLLTILISHLNKEVTPMQEVVNFVWDTRGNVINYNNVAQLTHKVRQKVSLLNRGLTIVTSEKKGVSLTTTKKLHFFIVTDKHIITSQFKIMLFKLFKFIKKQIKK